MILNVLFGDLLIINLGIDLGRLTPKRFLYGNPYFGPKKGSLASLKAAAMRLLSLG